MNYEIKTSSTGNCKYVQVFSDKGSLLATVGSFTPPENSRMNSYFQVIVNNASHRAWKGSGKFFHSVDEIKNYYSNAAVITNISIDTCKYQ